MHLRDAMHRVASLAQAAKGWTAPNPPVAALVLCDGKVLGEGVHPGAGYPHAEVLALAQVPKNQPLHDATMVVSLEPCCHWGRTPPCTLAIRERGLGHVVFGSLDPNPKVAGQGRAELEEHGITCTLLPHPQLDATYQAYRYWQRTGRAWLTGKLAVTPRGASMAADRQPVAITGSSAKAWTHHQRFHADALLTTAATVACDQPRMNARWHQQSFAKPLVLVDRGLQTPTHARCVEVASEVHVFCADTPLPNDTTWDARFMRWQSMDNVHLHPMTALDPNDSHWLLSSLAEHCGALGWHHVWVETGATFLQGALNAGILNELWLYVAGSTPPCQPTMAEPLGLTWPSLSRPVAWYRAGLDHLALLSFATPNRHCASI